MDPAVHDTEYGVVWIVPSTLTNPEPVGFEVIVMVSWDGLGVALLVCVKLACMLPCPFIVAVVDGDDESAMVIWAE